MQLLRDYLHPPYIMILILIKVLVNESHVISAHEKKKQVKLHSRCCTSQYVKLIKTLAFPDTLPAVNAIRG
jgi:hypothetical protein